MELAAAISAALVMTLAIVAAVLLRSVRPGSEPERQASLKPDEAVAASAGVELRYGGE